METVDVIVREKQGKTFLEFPKSFPEPRRAAPLENKIANIPVEHSSDKTILSYFRPRHQSGQHSIFPYLAPGSSALVMLVAGCTLGPHTVEVPEGTIGPGGERILEQVVKLQDVPYARGLTGPQQTCLGAALDMGLLYLGLPIPQEEVGIAVYNPLLSGGGNQGGGDMGLGVRYARKLGLAADHGWVKLDMIKDAIRDGVPVVLGKEFTETDRRYHAVLAFGFDDISQCLTYHDSVLGPNQRISYSELQKLTVTDHNPDPSLYYNAMYVCWPEQDRHWFDRSSAEQEAALANPYRCTF